MSPVRCNIRRGLSANSLDPKVGAGGLQLLEYLDIVVLRRDVRRRETAMALMRHVGAPGDQYAHQLRSAARDGRLERLIGDSILGDRIDSRTL